MANVFAFADCVLAQANVPAYADCALAKANVFAETSTKRVRPAEALAKAGGTKADHMRRWMLGNSCQTFTPQKCEPSVQMGEAIPARR